ncbi:MAG TPA: amylo-alpha-1,6-glucosidase [Armatimonadota bacterium]|nr:amylo-alpha-1,6-glucosidase [Armatimonadota bacterium]
MDRSMHVTGPFRLDEATDREWILTNGLGGYASATLCGTNTRRYHGLLVAALHPPGQRTLLVAKLEEVLKRSDIAYPLSTNQYPGTFHPDGYRFLNEFAYEDETVQMRFIAGDAVLDKRITMVQGENTTRVTYTNQGDESFALSLTPLLNARDFHGETAEGSIWFNIDHSTGAIGPQVHVRPQWMPDGYWLYADGGEWVDDRTWYRNMFYCWEQRRGLTATDNHFSPGHFQLDLAPGESLTVMLSTEPPPTQSEIATGTVTLQQRDTQQFYIPQDASPEVQQLFRTAHSFLVQRADIDQELLARGRTIIAGYHWFGDWGRDTMIALPGLCLTTKRYADAAEILRTFAAARRHGLLPNLFLDSGEGEAYNAVDASLWYVYAVERYFQATHDRMLVEELRPALEEIIHYYRVGTDFGIGMDRDALINASAPGWQLTWMDAKVGDWVVTPRMGKPVEINALWYNALRVMERFSRDFGWADNYGQLAEKVRKHFSAYWNPQLGYLYDVLSDHPDTHLRPNQIFAVSLPYSPLDLNQARAVVNTVQRYLLTPYGLRTLAPQDDEYQGTYGGNRWERDGAYHQGTVWAWLMGPYIDAYLRVNGHTERAKAVCRILLRPLLAHVWDAGIGSVSELFDGNPPHLPGGTISQAWSVAEVIRVWKKCRPA